MKRGNDRILFGEHQRVFSKEKLIEPYKYDDEGGRSDAYLEYSHRRAPECVEFGTEFNLDARKLYISTDNTRTHDDFENSTCDVRTVFSTFGMSSHQDLMTRADEMHLESKHSFWFSGKSSSSGGGINEEGDEQKLNIARERLYGVFPQRESGRKEYHLTYLNLLDTNEMSDVVVQLLEAEVPLHELFFLAERTDRETMQLLIDHLEKKQQLSDEEKYWLAVAYSWGPVRDVEKASQLAIESWTRDHYQSSLLDHGPQVHEAARSVFLDVSPDDRVRQKRMVYDRAILKEMVEQEWELKDFPITFSSIPGERITIVFPIADRWGESLGMESMEIGDIPDRNMRMAAGEGARIGGYTKDGQHQKPTFDEEYAYFRWRQTNKPGQDPITWTIELRDRKDDSDIDFDNPHLKFYLIRADVRKEHAELAEQQ
ncbi:hypothetical protein Pla110_12220 [Polystyrenella longa]|uniref:Uncharacterized protein n=1 Tax=Polystyrenella longa TaxID=2528007 RepID=A0A518CJW1_9PLAN|nr:hypothetical protein [Polystyrenella longa]QDU79512.1 hypothetical protein Pla110_12220 [Polystyrenella longa]